MQGIGGRDGIYTAVPACLFRIDRLLRRVSPAPVVADTHNFDGCLIKRARELDIHRLFDLPYQLPFFNALGFSIVEKEVLPQKVWVDCVNCPKFPDCDETAVLLEI